MNDILSKDNSFSASVVLNIDLTLHIIMYEHVGVARLYVV
jgi:hypothetical protein